MGVDLRLPGHQSFFSVRLSELALLQILSTSSAPLIATRCSLNFVRSLGLRQRCWPWVEKIVASGFSSLRAETLQLERVDGDLQRPHAQAVLWPAPRRLLRCSSICGPPGVHTTCRFLIRKVQFFFQIFSRKV